MQYNETLKTFYNEVNEKIDNNDGELSVLRFSLIASLNYGLGDLTLMRFLRQLEKLGKIKIKENGDIVRL